MSFLRNLQVKVLLSALIPGTAILIIVALIALYQYGGAVQKVVEQRDAELARLTAHQLRNALDQQTHVLAAIAGESGLQSLHPDRARISLTLGQSGLESFDGGVVLYDRLGMPVVSNDDTDPADLAPYPEDATFDQLSDTLSPVYSDVFTERKSGRSAIRMAVPVVSAKRDFIGVLAGVATLDGELMHALLTDPLDVAPGEDGLSYVVDSTGRSIFHSHSELVGVDLKEYPPVSEVTRGASGANLSTSPIGEAVISAFSPVPGTGWGVITQQRWSQVEGPFRNSSVTVLGLLVFGAILASGGIWFFMGRALKPIKELNSGAQRIASGDFDYTIPADTGDEVQELAQQFNLMAQALKASYTELEDRVERRTSELAESEERVRAASVENAAMAEIGRVIGSSLDIGLVYARFAEQTERLISSDMIAILNVHPDGSQFRVAFMAGMSIPERMPNETYPMEGTATAEAYMTGQPVLYQPTDEADVLRDYPGLMPVWHEGIRSFLAVPLISHNEVIGILWIGSRSVQAYSNSDLECAGRVSAQIAGAVANAQLYDEIQQFYAQEQRRADQFRTIGEVGRQITSILDTDEILTSIGQIGTTSLGYEMTALGIVEGDELVFWPRANPHLSAPVRRSLAVRDGPQGITGLVATTGEAIIVPDVDAEPRYLALGRARDVRSSVTVPVSAGGHAIGVLHSQSRRVNAFDEADQVVLQALAQEIGIAIENARIFEAERRRNEQMAAINGVALNVSAVLTLGELLPHVVQLVRETFGYHTVGVFLLDENDEEIVLQAVDSSDEMLPVRGTRVLIGGEGIVGHVAGTGLPWITGDVSNDPFYSDLGFERVKTRSELAMPIKEGDVVVGVLDLHSAESDAFDDIDMLIAQTLANQLAVAIENARIFDETRDLAVLEERNRMAREIHDTLAQGFTGIVIHLEAGEDSMNDDLDELRGHIGVAKALARECLAEARRSVWNLLPEALERNPLDVIIADEVERFAATVNGSAEFTLLGARREFPAAARAAIMRICQESLTNIRNYADANKVHVTLDFTLDAVTLTVEDDGVGFDPGSIRIGEGQGGFGLTGMRQRARLLRGDVDIISAPGKGTIVRARIPIS